MSKYDVRNYVIEKKQQEQSGKHTRRLQSINNMLQVGSQFASDIIDKIGTQQANNYMTEFENDFRLKNVEGYFYKDESGNYLSPEKSQEKYDNYISEYKQTHRLPTNGVALTNINNSFAARRDSDLTRNMTTALQGYIEQRNNNTKTLVENTIGVQISNIQQYNETILHNYGISYDSLNDLEKNLYDANSQTDSHLLNVAINMRQAGYEETDINNYISSIRYDYAEQEFRQDAKAAYSNNVINGNQDSAQFFLQIEEDLKNTDMFGRALTNDEINSIKSGISSDTKLLEDAKDQETEDLWVESLYPWILEKDISGTILTSEELYSKIDEIGIDMSRLSLDTRTSLYTITSYNDNLLRMEEPFRLLDENARSDRSHEEKIAEYNRIMDSVDLPTKTLIESFADTYPLYGTYSSFNFEEMIASQRMTYTGLGVVSLTKDDAEALMNKPMTEEEYEYMYNELSEVSSLLGAIEYYNSSEDNYVPEYLSSAIKQYTDEGMNEIDAITALSNDLVSRRRNLIDSGFSAEDINSYKQNTIDNLANHKNAENEAIKDFLSANSSEIISLALLYNDLLSKQAQVELSVRKKSEWRESRTQEYWDYIKSLPADQRAITRENDYKEWLLEQISLANDMFDKYSDIELKDGETLNSHMETQMKVQLLETKNENSEFRIVDENIDRESYVDNLNDYNEIYRMAAESFGDEKKWEQAKLKFLEYKTQKLLTQEQVLELESIFNNDFKKSLENKGISDISSLISSYIPDMNTNTRAYDYVMKAVIGNNKYSITDPSYSSQQLRMDIMNDTKNYYSKFMTDQYLSLSDPDEWDDIYSDKKTGKNIVNVFESGKSEQMYDYYNGNDIPLVMDAVDAIISDSTTNLEIIFDKGIKLKESYSQTTGDSIGISSLMYKNVDKQGAKKSDLSTEDKYGIALNAYFGLQGDSSYQVGKDNTAFWNDVIYPAMDDMDTADRKMISMIVGSVVGISDAFEMVSEQYPDLDIKVPSGSGLYFQDANGNSFKPIININGELEGISYVEDVNSINSTTGSSNIIDLDYMSSKKIAATEKSVESELWKYKNSEEGRSKWGETIKSTGTYMYDTNFLKTKAYDIIQQNDDLYTQYKTYENITGKNLDISISETFGGFDVKIDFV